MVLALAIGCSQPSGEAIRNPDARDVVSKMESTYATCKTLSDNGTVTSESTKLSFELVYQSPEKLYFEFGSGPKKSSLIASGSTVKTILAPSTVTESKSSIGAAVEELTSPSLGVAHHVPRMLFPKDVGGVDFGHMSDAILEKSALVEGDDCYVVNSGEWNTRLFISKSTHLLRKIVENYADEQTTVFHPQINGPVDERVFNEPSKK